MIIVCGLNAAQNQVDQHSAKTVISILGPETPHRDFKGVDANSHLKLTFNDINLDTPGLIAPKASDAQKLLNFIESWDQKNPLLIHCWAGISRSTAAAFTALCLLRPNADEMSLARNLREASASATPNRLIVAQIDSLLGREGRMLSAVESIGRGANAFEGTPFILHV
jgi:predicted protein tyrosine phosphatase